MTAVQASVIRAVFSALIRGDTVAPLNDSFDYRLPIAFSEVSDISIINGQYIPANDYVYIFNNLHKNHAPNWMIISTDGFLNVNLGKTQSGGIFNGQVKRFTFLSWKADETDFASAMYLDGRLSAPLPMAQGEAVNYTIVFGRGNLN